MLELTDISKNYTSADTVCALDRVSLSFGDSGLVSVLGPSGCGKTTLLNIIGGLDTPTGGMFTVDGECTADFSARDLDAYRNHRVGFVFQSYNLIPHLSVLGNVELSLALCGVKRAERKRRALAALERVGLSDQAHKRPAELSGGQMQRVAVARAVVNDPDIILADEPTGALDSATGEQVLRLLKDLSCERLVITVTHNRELALKYSDRIITMLDGEITSDNPNVPTAQAADAPTGVEQNGDGAENIEAGDALGNATESVAAPSGAPSGKKRSAMGILTALNLSFRNLLTKKGRAAATVVAGAIGVLGVALVLALSNGFGSYIADMQTSMLAHYPVTVTQVTVDINGTVRGGMNSMSVQMQSTPSGNELVITDSGGTRASFYRFNRMSAEYADYIAGMPRDCVTDVAAEYAKRRVIVGAHTTGGYGALATVGNELFTMVGSNSTAVKTLLNNTDYVLSQYDVVSGVYPNAADEIAVVVDADGSIDKSTLARVGLPVPQGTPKYADLLGGELKLVFNDVWYTYNDRLGYYVAFDNTSPTQQQYKALYDDPRNVTLKVVGVLRLKSTAKVALFKTGIAVTPALDALILENSRSSAAAIAQQNAPDRCMSDALVIQIGSDVRLDCSGKTFVSAAAALNLMCEPFGLTFSADDVRELAARAIGLSDVPQTFKLYPASFGKKSKMLKYLEAYNADRPSSQKIVALDAADVLTSTASDLVDIMTYVLIAFAAIALVVSGVMTGAITYASVGERIKEIGVLRAVGARKTDIARVFMAETAVTGFAAGVIGVAVTAILSLPIGAAFAAISGGLMPMSVVSLAWWHVLLLPCLSVAVSLVSGLLPALKAARRNPASALAAE